MNNVNAKMLERNIGEKINEEKILAPNRTGIILKFYDKNPYRKYETTETGLIFGTDGNKEYKSQETGEMEESEIGVACAKVIYIGPECKYCLPGDDVYVYKDICKPIPFHKYGYYFISEENVFCRIKNKE